MSNKHLNMESQYTASPLRRKSLVSNRFSRLSIAPDVINDDEAELRRRRQSGNISTSTPNASINHQTSNGLGNLVHLSADQLQEKIRHCIQLNAENKINVKNVFSLPAIDILTYLVKHNKTQDLQIASSSLDVSSKIYGLRVDKVYSEVYKICSNLGKEKMNNSLVEEEAERNENDPAAAENENGLRKEKRKKRRKGNLLSTVEALRGNVEAISITSAMSNQDDPQTSDVLNQIQATFQVKDCCYLRNLNAPVFDTIEDALHYKCTKYPTTIISPSQLSKNIQMSFPFSFLKWSKEDDMDDDDHYKTAMEIDIDNQPDAFHFDLDEVPDNTPFPTQDTCMDSEFVHRNDCQRLNDDAQNIVDFRQSIIANMNYKSSEYTYLPHDLIHFSGPSYWKIVKRRKPNSQINQEQCKQQRKKKYILIVFDENDDIDMKYELGQRVRCTESTLNAWNDDKTTLYNNIPDEVDYLDMFRCFEQSDRYIKLVKIQQSTIRDKENTVVGDDHANDQDAMNDVINDSSRDMDDNEIVSVLNDNTELQTQNTALMGGNLVNAPDLVENIHIPYSKKAKKIDVRQVKKSMITLIRTELKSSNISNILNRDDQEETLCQFSDIYKQLPKLLSKSNSETMSVPIAFVSLLHLANEKTLNIRSTIDASNLIITQD